MLFLTKYRLKPKKIWIQDYLKEHEPMIQTVEISKNTFLELVVKEREIRYPIRLVEYYLNHNEYYICKCIINGEILGYCMGVYKDECFKVILTYVVSKHHSIGKLELVRLAFINNVFRKNKLTKNASIITIELTQDFHEELKNKNCEIIRVIRYGRPINCYKLYESGLINVDDIDLYDKIYKTFSINNMHKNITICKAETNDIKNIQDMSLKYNNESLTIASVTDFVNTDYFKTFVFTCDNKMIGYVVLYNIEKRIFDKHTRPPVVLHNINECVVFKSCFGCEREYVPSLYEILNKYSYENNLYDIIYVDRNALFLSEQEAKVHKFSIIKDDEFKVIIKK